MCSDDVIFIRDGPQLRTVSRSSYDSEEVLQRLLA